ncbi:hypothetical protein SNOUR_10305 [Streptomyces noursei ATCC 11455]|nr:hypothetical protein SNOUR_10305 [Streptomyces noursei ATCC 11455]
MSAGDGQARTANLRKFTLTSRTARRVRSASQPASLPDIRIHRTGEYRPSYGGGTPESSPRQGSIRRPSGTDFGIDKAWTAAPYRIATHVWNSYVANPQVARLIHHLRLMVGGELVHRTSLVAQGAIVATTDPQRFAGLPHATKDQIVAEEAAERAAAEAATGGRDLKATGRQRCPAAPLRKRPLREQVARRHWIQRGCPRCHAGKSEPCTVEDPAGTSKAPSEIPHDERLQPFIDERKAMQRKRRPWHVYEVTCLDCGQGPDARCESSGGPHTSRVARAKEFTRLHKLRPPVAEGQGADDRDSWSRPDAGRREAASRCMSPASGWSSGVTAGLTPPTRTC